MAKPRRPFKFWAMAALIALTTVIGLVLLAVGPDSDTRLSGLMCLLFFGLGGFGYLGGPLLTHRGAGPVQCSRVETSAGSEAAFVFPTPRGKRRLRAVAAAGMASGSVVLAIMTGGSAIVIACAAFFVGILALILVNARRPEYLALTPTRVTVNAGTGAVEVPWDAVDDVQVYAMPAGQTSVDMLGVSARDRDAVIWTRGSLLGRLGRRFSAYDLTIGADAFAGEAERVVDAIRRYRDEPDRRRGIGSEQEHERLMGEIGEAAVPA